MSQFSKMTGIIVVPQLGDRSAEIPKESFSNFRSLDNPARNRWQIGKQIIATTCAKLLPHVRSPVLVTILPAINVRDGKRAGCTNAANQFSNERREMRLDCFFAQLVTFQTKTLFGHWMIF